MYVSYLSILLIIQVFANPAGGNISAGKSGIFLSETDELSSEEDTLFMNGHNRNLEKPEDNRVKANNMRNKLRAWWTVSYIISCF